jgi:uncharacterized membrane protein
MSVHPFTPEQVQAIETAISEAERQTSGEIRIHIDDHCPGDALNRARVLFNSLGMTETVDRNGVLLYIAIEDHKLAIYGDIGIHATVGLNYWAGIIDLITQHARKGDLAGGIVEGIHGLGQVLKKYFPYSQDDVNELHNTISFG